jgi:hypothetical protein
VALPQEARWVEVRGESSSDRFETQEYYCPWLTPLVLSLAQGAYDNRNSDGTLNPEQLAVLSDALEDAGCPTEVKSEAVCEGCGGKGYVGVTYLGPNGRDVTEDDHCPQCHGNRVIRSTSPHPLLAHLRSPGPYYRGDWAVDLLLGKE